QKASAASPNSAARCTSSQSGSDQRSASRRGGCRRGGARSRPASARARGSGTPARSRKSEARSAAGSGAPVDAVSHASRRRHSATPKIASTAAVRSSAVRSRRARRARSTSRSAAAPSSTRAIAGSATSARRESQGTCRSLSTGGAVCRMRDRPGASRCARTGASPSCRAMDDPRQLLEEGRFDELANDDHPLWRGLALLQLKRWGEAARTFEEAPDAGESGSMLELAGAARWLAGERAAAVERWISALDAGYEGPAGGAQRPARRVDAGARRGDERAVMRGTRLLTKAWKPKIQRIWPGPVAGYLLGQVDAKSFLEEGYSDPDLEARRLASAHFWSALKDPVRAREHYQAAVANEG